MVPVLALVLTVEQVGDVHVGGGPPLVDPAEVKGKSHAQHPIQKVANTVFA